MGTKHIAKPNIRPDWMKKSPKVSKQYAKKRAQNVREWDTWPKASEHKARRSDMRLEAAINRAMRDEEKRARTLQKIEALNIPKRLRPEVARVRQYMGGSIHDPVAVASVETFYLGVELQGLFPEFRKQITGRQNAARTNKNRADERYEYARAQFTAIRKQRPNLARHLVIEQANRLTREKYGILKKWSKRKMEMVAWPSERTQVKIYKGMK